MTGAVIGVDVGGTFTDLMVLDPETGQVRIAKVPTTVGNQAIGVMAALADSDISLGQISAISHGTTTTTNALLEGKISACGLITTKGFRDVLELGRRTRPRPYGMTGSFEPLVPRERRLEVTERMAADGTVMVPLDESELRQMLAQLIDIGCESLVIHFLHSYRNPVHENRALAIARDVWPNDYITAGHRILSEFREYERGTTAAVNAAVQPVLHHYIVRLSDELKRGGFERDLIVMQGNGGSVAAKIVAERAVNTVMSGPASGVMAAAAVARACALDRVITYDMGGTSSDVGLVLDGVPAVTSETELTYGMPIHVPMVDVHTIGAGGGSIAAINKAGMVQVGPESAGADPGPICYGRGGTRPTLTDANLVLGRLRPDGLLGVDAPVSRAAVEDALVAYIGASLGLTAPDAAAAILSIANDRMAGAVRLVSLARGHDPRDFTMFAFGGAGPMHASALARELGIPRVMIPARPGVTNAIGCITADLRHDYVTTLNTLLADLDGEVVTDILARQEAEGRDVIAREGVAVREIVVKHFADMQFEGQTHMLTVPMPEDCGDVAALQRAFAAAYWDRFAVELAEIRAVLVNLHSVVIGRRPVVSLQALAPAHVDRSRTCDGPTTRPVWFTNGWRETPVYQRDQLSRDEPFDGPAIVEQLDGTTVIEPGDRAHVDGLGNLVIEVAR